MKMSTQYTPEALRNALQLGLLSFPVTDFDAEDVFDERSFTERLEWLSTFGSSAIFAAGGAGEFFSLSAAEYAAIVACCVNHRSDGIPVIAATGYGTQQAIHWAQEAERLGADGLLLLPPYLTEGSQSGLAEHIAAVCRATRLGVIIYNRANMRVRADTLTRLAERCPNLIGFKDGVGDFEELMKVRTSLGERIVCINGMPTAEIYAEAFIGAGVPVYSSAIFNFIPSVAMRVYEAFNAGHKAFLDAFKREFLVPYASLRARQPGYAVSVIKAGVQLIGRSAGHVRPPLSDLTPTECDELARLIERARTLEHGHA
jgi:5-dehydro-4-deoxyglucarate dehydratase